jgi:hypothetical protein
MRKFVTKKTAALAGVLAIGISGVSAAYLAADGTGTGKGQVSAELAEMVLTSSELNLKFLGDSQRIDITAANPGKSPQRIGGDLAVVARPTKAALDAGCPEGSFTVDRILPTNAEVPAATNATTPGTAIVATARVTFTSLDAPQNGCLLENAIRLTMDVN